MTTSAENAPLNITEIIDNSQVRSFQIGIFVPQADIPSAVAL